MEDKDILKIGVNPFEVALKLCDYDVRTESIFDLRYLAEMCNNRSAPLHMLSAEYLKVKLNDDFRLDQKHWKKEKSLLKMQDINYAAKVGRATIGLFEKFKEKLMCDKPQTNDLQAFIDANVKPSLNKIYRYQKKNADENQIYKAPYDPIKCNDVRVISDIDSCRAIVQQLREYSFFFQQQTYCKKPQWNEINFHSHFQTLQREQSARFWMQINYQTNGYSFTIGIISWVVCTYSIEQTQINAK